MTRKEKALDLFSGEYHCSQSVLGAFARELGLDEELAKAISLGLAGGSGTHGYCGCISGAYMVLSLKYGADGPGNPEVLGRLVAKNKAFYQAFRQHHCHVNCRDLIRLDVFTEEGMAKFMAQNLKQTFCADLVSHTIDILESLMAEDGQKP